MSKKIKVFLADDTLIAREGWQRILETVGDIVVVGEGETAALTIEKVNKLKPDVLLMDLHWFGDDTAGWAAIREIKQKHGAKIRIIAVTAYERIIADARRMGADSVLEKTFSREQLLNEIYVQANRSKDTIDTPVHPSVQEVLTGRELQVLQLIEEGHSDKEIAKLLVIAHATAKNHVKRILEKLSAKNRTQAVSLAREVGLLK
jgi:DNA-binding NarL/FixJ family response regulator